MDWDLSSLWDTFVNAFENKFWQLLGDLAQFFADILNSIPVPGFLGSLSGYIAAIPPGVLYWLEPFNVSWGFGIISAALTARLLLSLIPFIGSAFR